MPIDYSQSALARANDIIVSSELQSGLGTATITFGPPKITTKYGYNTRAVAKIRRGVKLRNCVALYLNRLDLTAFFTQENITDITAPGAVTSHDLLPIILSEHGISLTTDDIILDTLADTNYTITAKTTSLGWTGSFQFNAEVLVYPPLVRTSSNFLIVTSTGKFIRRSIPAYNPGV